jgi:hypothetical protein
MATQTVSGGVVTKESTKNNHGTAKNVGVSASVLSNQALGGSNVGVFGSTVVDNSSADKALSAGTFKYDNKSPIAKRVSTSLSGVSNSYLRSGAAVPGLVRSIHKLEVLRTRRLTTAIRAGNWNIYTGKFSSDPVVAVDTLATDSAATPTRNVPGQLVYKTGAIVPVQDDYKPKTN